MKSIPLILATLPLAASVAFAQVSGHAHVYCAGPTATLYVSASAAAVDQGRPGAWFIAAHHPNDAAQVAFLTPEGWVVPGSSGMLIPYGVHPGGIPGSITATACAPQLDEYGSFVDFGSCGSTTETWAGYILKVGYGVLTPEAEMLVATRRARLDSAKPIMQQQGRWRPEYDDDERMRHALVVKSMREGRIADVLTIPAVQCGLYGN